ncbi:MAG: hypothetical protein ACRCWJ_11615 [Casimicrobium sp.]
MAITTLDGIVDALANNSSRVIIDKASIANTAASQIVSLWRATGQPGQGGIPAATATCNNTTAGGMGFAQQTAPATSYLAYLSVTSGNNAMGMEIHDRLAHMGGLNGTLTTAQTVSLDLSTLLATDNIASRIGDANYSDVQWWMEWYADTGATASNATINVTYNDATTGNLTLVAVGGTVRASRVISLNALVPAAQSGKFIRAINNVTLSASTATAGNFGFTATRLRGAFPCDLGNRPNVFEWTATGLPEIHNGSCLFPIAICSFTNTGYFRGSGKIAHG